MSQQFGSFEQSIRILAEIQGKQPPQTPQYSVLERAIQAIQDAWDDEMNEMNNHIDREIERYKVMERMPWLK